MYLQAPYNDENLTEHCSSCCALPGCCDTHQMPHKCPGAASGKSLEQVTEDALTRHGQHCGFPTAMRYCNSMFDSHTPPFYGKSLLVPCQAVVCALLRISSKAAVNHCSAPCAAVAGNEGT